MKKASEVAVEVKNLKKYFGDVKALDGVTLRVDRGKDVYKRQDRMHTLLITSPKIVDTRFELLGLL